MAYGGTFVDLAALFTALAMVVLTVVGMFAAGPGGGQPARGWFAWHPVLMSVAFPALMVLGRFAYLTDEARPLEVKRKDHRTLMALATAAMLIGYLCIFMAHLPKKKFFGYDFENGQWSEYRRVAHAWLGYLLIFMVLCQAISGVLKLSSLRKGGKRVLTSHGNFGKGIIVLGGFNVLLAVRFWGWSSAFKVPMYAVTLLSVIFGVIWPRPEKQEMRVLIGEEEG